ncbi:hypothetical protein EVC45_27560 [Paraburkholderia sp. UYCP14C]|uniref:hypothetical protein n=1 Tax=Paraburkholderia sp. UYCP14C TaxID=2511130 RepID=UPI001020D078|nr:hypothetical protein [Paraburkholderia sp. UYCP14C]RZF26487.1 hypothetical protein EVC45_27560 [Paraburkholderia sp. UYCP14C]
MSYLLEGRVAAPAKINPWLLELATDINFHGPADAFCFDSLAAVRCGIDTRDGTAEAQGWLRCPPSGRHLADDDASTGYVQP